MALSRWLPYIAMLAIVAIAVYALVRRATGGRLIPGSHLPFGLFGSLSYRGERHRGI